MKRPSTYVGQQVYEWAFSAPAQHAMTALAKVCQALFGTSTTVNGLACTPTSPAGMTVQIGAGEIYQMESLEATACGTLPADTTHTILKQGIQLDSYTTAAFTAPTSTGQSIAYLIEAQYQDSDISIDPTTGTTPVVLQFYNSTTPASPWSGPNNSGSTSNTFRDGIIAYSIKAGVAATTGSQVTPTPDSGYVGLWVVTVAYGQTTITASNIAAYSGSPVLSASLLAQIQARALTNGSTSNRFSVAPAVAATDAPDAAQVQASAFTTLADTGAANAYVTTFSPALSAPAPGAPFWMKVKTANTGASTLNATGTAYPLIGGAHAALTGGELVANGWALIVWNVTLSSYVLLECTGAAVQVGTGTGALHAVQKQQISSTEVSGTGTNTASAAFSFTPPTAGKILVIASAGSTGNQVTLVTPTASGTTLTGGNNFASAQMAQGHFIGTVTAGTAVSIALGASASSATVNIYALFIFLPA